MQLVKRQAAHRAGKVLAERERWAVDDVDMCDPVGQTQCGLERLAEATFDALLANQAVYNHLDGVLEISVELDRFGEIPHLPVDPRPAEPLLRQIRQQRLVLAFPTADDGSEHLESGPLFELQHLIDDLLRGLTGNRCAVVWTMRDADPCEEQAQVVVDLGDGPDRRPRVLARRLLIDRNRRRQALDEIDVRLVHLAEELTGIGGEALHIATLALGVDRVECQRRLP